MTALPPIAVRDATAAAMLELPLPLFRELVAAGALPQPVMLGPYERWHAARIKCIAIGAAHFWDRHFDRYDEIDWDFLLSLYQKDRPYRYVSPKVRAEVIARDGEACVYCGSTAGPFHIDHIHPVSLGGDSDAENLCVACAPCNLSKRNMTVEEWRRRASGAD